MSELGKNKVFLITFFITYCGTIRYVYGTLRVRGGSLKKGGVYCLLGAPVVEGLLEELQIAALFRGVASSLVPGAPVLAGPLEALHVATLGRLGSGVLVPIAPVLAGPLQAL